MTARSKYNFGGVHMVQKRFHYSGTSYYLREWGQQKSAYINMLTCDGGIVGWAGILRSWSRMLFKGSQASSSEPGRPSASDAGALAIGLEIEKIFLLQS